jgi:hypothetical protein
MATEPPLIRHRTFMRFRPNSHREVDLTVDMPAIPKPTVFPPRRRSICVLRCGRPKRWTVALRASV